MMCIVRMSTSAAARFWNIDGVWRFRYSARMVCFEGSLRGRLGGAVRRLKTVVAIWMGREGLELGAVCRRLAHRRMWRQEHAGVPLRFFLDSAKALVRASRYRWRAEMACVGREVALGLSIVGALT